MHVLLNYIIELINTKMHIMDFLNVNSSTYIDFGIVNNEESPKFEVGGHVIISIHKNIFAKKLRWP